ncbi:BA14K family protein [Stakelama sp. CBK3Z-3]|uniref:BA14K family protein n=1 Tax=Stakelama flava TaxID=2860338 RepID=A0ABS6XJ48_9SPHN|nr:BA14K family protein [Stakelama flava]
MKKTAIIIAAIGALTTTAVPAFAQSHQERRPAARHDDHSGRNDDTPPPAHWNRGKNEWSHHVAACKARYHTYNARTDMFYARPGVKKRCRL